MSTSYVLSTRPVEARPICALISESKVPDSRAAAAASAGRVTKFASGTSAMFEAFVSRECAQEVFTSLRHDQHGWYMELTYRTHQNAPEQQAPRCPESNVLDMSVFNWMQQSVDAAHCITRDDIKKATFAAWEEMPESVILNSFGHLASVHETIVKNKGGNNPNQ